MRKISIIGRGVDPSIHLSLGGIRALRDANKIVGIEPEKDFWNQFRKDFHVGEIEDVTSLYTNHDTDIDNYNRFIDYILNLSSKFGHLALLVAGHPRLGVTFIELLQKKLCPKTELNIIDGISSFDVMMSYFEHDPLEQGTTLVDANRLLLFNYKLENAFSYFIYHVCSIGNSTTNYLNPSSGNRIDLFKKYLLKYYPENKEVFLCRISNGKNEISSHIQSTIGNLEECLSKIDFSTTLYIPAEKPKKIDWNYLKLLRNNL